MTKGYEQRKNANERYLATLDKITIRVSKESGMKDAIRAHAEGAGESVQAFIVRAIQETMRNDKRKRAVLDGEGAQWMEDYLKEE